MVESFEHEITKLVSNEMSCTYVYDDYLNIKSNLPNQYVHLNWLLTLTISSFKQ